MFSEYTDALFEFVSSGGLEPEIRKARSEFFAEVKDVYAEEEFFEERINAFLEWYCIDRTVGKTGRTPLLLFLEKSHATLPAGTLDYLNGFREARHALFEIRGMGEGRVEVRDIFSREEFSVTERRPLGTLKKGDVCETRLVPYRSEIFFSRTFLVFPREARRVILSEVRRARKARRLDAPAFMRTLAVLWVRQRRYKGVDPRDLFSPAELAKPNSLAV
ncbi:MAG: hypothetical protein HY897_16400 [Deltaproteobacteria bacterium]|nr:hypothetical protein [Deltaproteobacteria bacterium]